MIEDLTAVEAYADAAHDSIRQFRKYPLKGVRDPYKTHPRAVRKRVAKYVPGYVPEGAALVHDVDEDVRKLNPIYGLHSIRQYFGPDIHEVAFHLTNVYTTEAYPTINALNRAKMEADRLDEAGDTRLGFFIHSVKLADVIENMSSLPWEEDPGFAKFFATKSRDLFTVLTRGHRGLQDELGAIFQGLHNSAIFELK